MKTIYTIDNKECSREEFLDEMSANYHPDVFDGYMQWEEYSDSLTFEDGIFKAVKEG
jgi:hypothetical protein